MAERVVIDAQTAALLQAWLDTWEGSWNDAPARFRDMDLFAGQIRHRLAEARRVARAKTIPRGGSRGGARRRK